MKVEFSQELVELFKKTCFEDECAVLINLDRGKPIDIEPDEDGYIYIPELTALHPTTLVRNGEGEDDCYDFIFITKLINEFRKQVKGE